LPYRIALARGAKSLSVDIPSVIPQAHVTYAQAGGGGCGAEDQAMQSQSRFFDDLARVAAGAMGTLSGVKSEVEARLREQLDRVLASMDLVSRDEFEAVKAMAARARAEQENLEKRVAELESRLAALSARETAASAATGDGTPGLS
jgi:BMFP domain-containing protein YqiC